MTWFTNSVIIIIVTIYIILSCSSPVTNIPHLHPATPLTIFCRSHSLSLLFVTQPARALRVLQTSLFVRVNATAAPDRIVAASQSDGNPLQIQTITVGQATGPGTDTGVRQTTELGIDSDTGNVPTTSRLEKLLYSHPLPVPSSGPLANAVPEHQKNSLVW